MRQSVANTVSDKFYYGWLMLAVAGIGMFCSGPGQSFTFSVFIEPISEDLGISKTSIATAYALATLAAAFLLPYAGRQLDRFGPRKTLFAISIVLGFACMFFGAASGFLWLAYGFGVLRFLGQGTTMLTTSNLVSQWFVSRRGFAMSLLGLGFGLSMAIYPQIGEFLIGHYGWRTAWVIIGVLTWVLMMPPLLLVYDRPESIGLAVDGGVATAEKTDIEGLTSAQAKSEWAFYILCGTWFVVGGFITVLSFFQVSILSSNGVSSTLAAQLFSITAIVMMVSIPFIGKVYDIIRTRYVLAIEMFIISAALISITFVQGFLSGLVYALIFGVANAFMLTMFGYVWPRYFGRAHLGSIQGIGQMTGVIGASLAPLPVGFVLDRFGSAESMLIVFAALSFATGIFIVLKLRTPEGIQIPHGAD